MTLRPDEKMINSSAYAMPGFKDFKIDVRKGREFANYILWLVCDYFGEDVLTVIGKDRHKDKVMARHCAMYLIKKRTSLSLKTIGEMFNNRDHTTCIHAIKVIKGIIEVNGFEKEYIDDLTKLINQKTF